MVTSLERADLLALVGDVYCTFATFQCGIQGQVWYFIISFLDLCRPSLNLSCAKDLWNQSYMVT